MHPRLLRFLFCIALILIVFEVLARVNGPTFSALSDMMLLKIEVLNRSPETKVLFLGTSRFVDAIDQQIFDRELSIAAGSEFKCLNGASTGSQAERTAYFAAIAASNPNLTHVILEASPPALTSGDLGLPEAPAAQRGQVSTETSSDRGERFADRLETGLQALVSRNIALVKYREALRPGTLLKLPVLLMAEWVDPNIWMREGFIHEIFNAYQFEPSPEMVDRLIPTVFSKDSVPHTPDSAASGEYYNNLVRLSEIFEESGIVVIWVAPPVAEAETVHNSGGIHSTNYRSIVRQYDAFIYDYAASGTDDELLRDPTHLNASGRGNFSTALARDLAKHFQAKL